MGRSQESLGEIPRPNGIRMTKNLAMSSTHVVERKAMMKRQAGVSPRDAHLMGRQLAYVEFCTGFFPCGKAAQACYTFFPCPFGRVFCGI
jgi:hypothetical protein